MISSSLSLTFQTGGTGTSITVVLRLALSIATILGLRVGINLSVRISKSHHTIIALFSVTGSGWCFHGVLLVLTDNADIYSCSEMQFIAVSFQVFISSLFGTYSAYWLRLHWFPYT